MPDVESRRIFVDLSDLRLPGYLGNPVDRSLVTAHVYERFTPFADEGWVWTVFPGDAQFDGWVLEHVEGQLRVVGVELKCERVVEPSTAAPSHSISRFRLRQLAQRPWTAEPGSKRWRELAAR